MGRENLDKKGGNSPTDLRTNYVLHLPRPLSLEEKKYLLAVERDDLHSVKRILHVALKTKNIPDRKVDINCVDSLGRSALTLAIESENLEMIELLVVMGVETKDALLHAINEEFVAAVEFLLEHEDLVRRNEANSLETPNKEVMYSWQKVNPVVSRYSPDMTPLVLAAQKNNFKILKMLLERGATLPMPHDFRCDCEDCVHAIAEDPLRFSGTRISEYKALASPILIALSSPDPLMTAFQLSWELKKLAIDEPESRSEYLKLRRQVEKFAMDLLHQTRSTAELKAILNFNPLDCDTESTTTLPRLELAIRYKQKQIIAHPHVQQLMASMWYEGVPGFRRQSKGRRTITCIKTALLFPFYCLIYYFTPETKIGRVMRRPLMKFLIHASSYLFFLLVLILVSQRFEVEVEKLFESSDGRNVENTFVNQRGLPPSPLEYVVILYVLGFIFQEIREAYVEGIRAYLRDLWNFIDFTRNFLYVATAILRIAAYLQQQAEIRQDSKAAMIPREQWANYDPQLIAEGLFAAANVFSALKLVHLFSINPHLGPLQISLGRMVIDIVKFFFIYTLVLFAFACGLNQLLWYFAELERRKCYSGVADPSWDSASDSCIRWRRFSSLFESCQSLFWASFGGVGIDSFELTGIKSYTRFWGLLMFGSYSVINIIVLLNLLIAMMANSFTGIEEDADTEWKFARTKLWMKYFEEGSTLPPPFNIFPQPKLFLRLCGFHKRVERTRKGSMKWKQEYILGTSVMKALVWRYVANSQSQREDETASKDDIRQLKTDHFSWRNELQEILRSNGMKIDKTGTNESDSLTARISIQERRMNDFQLIRSGVEDESDSNFDSSSKKENNPAKWRRFAKLAVQKSAEHRWTLAVNGAVQQSQIGKSNSEASLRIQADIKNAMEEARRFVSKSPIPSEFNSIHVPENPHDATLFLTDYNNVRGSRPITPTTPTTIPATINFVNEKACKLGPQPLLSLCSSPPRVIKRKAPNQVISTNNNKSPCKQLTGLNPENNKHSLNVVSSSSRQIPEVAITPSTPKLDRERLVKIAPKSPQYSPSRPGNRSPRKKTWL